MSYLSKWKIFVLLLIVCIGSAHIYLRYANPLYEANATILIKNSQKIGTGMSETSVFEDLSVFGESQSIENEKSILNSRNIMRKVIMNLGIRHEYYSLGTVTGFNRFEQYNNAPIRIEFQYEDTISFINTRHQLKLKIENEKKVRIKTKLGGYTYEFNKWYSVQNKNIRIRVVPSKFFTKQQIGREYEYHMLPLEACVNKYLSKLSISQNAKNSAILQLTIRHQSKSKAVDVVNEIIAKYNEDAISDKNMISKNTSEFISRRVKVISKELGDVEDSAKEFKNENDLIDVSFESEIGLNYSKDIRQKLIEANTQLQLSNMMLDHLENNNSNNVLIPVNLGLADNRIESTIYEHNKLVMDRIDALKTTKEKNPIIINLSERITELKANIKSSINNLIEVKTKTVQEIEKEEQKIEATLNKMPKFEKELRGIFRQQQIKESLYLYLLQKREEARIALAVGLGNAKIVDPGYSNGSIVSPKYNVVYSFAVILALVLGFLYVYIKGLLYDKVYSKTDIDKFGLPYIGNIPLGEKNSNIVISKGSKTAISEAFRTLRTNIDFMMPKEKGNAKTIFITSTVAKEGKSFTAVNFSLSLALSGKKVLILGMDLRAPKLEDYMGNERSKGVTNYIVDSSKHYHDFIYTTELNSNIDVLPSGDIPPNPSELLMSDRVTHLFRDLKSKYDYIIVDTAPVGIVSDTLLISKYADTVVYVVRAHQLPRKMLNIASDLKAEERLPNMAILLNGTYGNKGYGYGYGYGYAIF